MTLPAITEARFDALAVLRPAPRDRLSRWIGDNVRLPEGMSALPGPLRLWSYQLEIADTITDPEIERVTVIKPVRVGFTTLLTGAIASFVANDPAPILVLLPTESDARDYVVSDIEPLFAATPAVAGTLATDVEEGQRNTLLHRRFAGGSLKVVAAKAPRNLRRHTARVLFIDEADAMEVGPEGSPILLAERRTMSFADRKIVLGSTPIYEDTSHVLRSYAQSDQRVREWPCPACGEWTEPLWAHIEWEPGQPDGAFFRCPHCKARIEESHKPAMEQAARWRATKPEIRRHAGFRLNALVSNLANARWGVLAAEFLRAKDDSDELQVFVNTILGQGWKEAAVEVDEQELGKRAEPFSLADIPPAVLLVTVGVDVQDDRLEASVLGFSRTEAFILGHVVFWGSPDENATWGELDEFLRTKWQHRGGGMLGVDCAMVDSGDSTEKVYDYCRTRAPRRIFALKGIAGVRPVCVPSQSKVRGLYPSRLMLAGVDTIKQGIYDRLARGRALRFSSTLEESYYEQLASERKVVRYSRGQPVRRFERKPGARAEALDCCVYGYAARHMLTNVIDLNTREEQLNTPAGSTPPPASGEAGTVFGRRIRARTYR